MNKNFIKNLSKKLFEWTGKRWIITLSKEEGLKTLYEKRIDDRDNLLKKEKQNKISKEMTSVFPDAELIDVKIEDD